MPRLRISRPVLRHLRVVALALLMLVVYVAVRGGFTDLARALYRT